MKTPEMLKEHEKKYSPDAWQEYTPAELGQWVALLLKRSGHRTDPAKRVKDLTDARAYYQMLGAHLDDAG